MAGGVSSPLFPSFPPPHGLVVWWDALACTRACVVCWRVACPRYRLWFGFLSSRNGMTPSSRSSSSSNPMDTGRVRTASGRIHSFIHSFIRNTWFGDGRRRRRRRPRRRYRFFWNNNLCACTSSPMVCWSASRKRRTSAMERSLKCRWGVYQ